MPVEARLDVSEKSNEVESVSDSAGASGAGAEATGGEGTAGGADPLPAAPSTGMAFAADTPAGGALGFFLGFGAASSVCFVFHLEMFPRT